VTPITAIYENGVFKPTEPVSLPEGSEVTVTPSPPGGGASGPPADDDETPGAALARELHWAMNRTEADILAARERLDKASSPPRPLPPGKTLDDMVRGKWPGDETDEQIREALERLS
jgi:hypothetical protein